MYAWYTVDEAFIDMIMLRTPVGFGALQRTTCYSYLGVYCVDSRMVDPQ